ncbi:MAG: hypothetical protein AB7K24_08360 [Gemmataceae bacterium]
MSRTAYLPLGILILFGVSCSQTRFPISTAGEEAQSIRWPKDWSTLVGKKITVAGTAQDRKLGATVVGEGESIWIDGLHSWQQDNDRRVRVTGIVITRNDLPVFVPKPGEPVPQGIPIGRDEDLEKASRRYLLQDARWETLP